MKVLFLDFDGVVSKGFTGKFENVGMIERFLLNHPDVSVVVCSDWRFSHTLDMLRSYFPETIRDRFIDTTPCIEYGNRSLEIRCWLQNNPHVTTYVAIDDTPEVYDNNFEQLVICSSAVGITEVEYKKLRRMLK